MNNKVPLQDAANERKLRLESLLESQKEKALRKRNIITRLKSECNEIQEQVACVKKMNEWNEMNGGSPTSTAVLSDGTIVVSDHRDDYIQIIK